MFYLVHPGPTGRGGRSLSPLGQPMPQDYTDEGYIYCGQCGLPVDLRKISTGLTEDSPGLQYVQTTVTIPGGTKQVWEANVVAGCPFCGSENPQLQNRYRPYVQRRQNVLRSR